MEDATRAEGVSDGALGLDEQLSLARIESSMFGAPPAVVRVDRYELHEQLGSGGMGVVRAAWDPELRRRVAIKLVHIGEVGTNGASRLLREAQAIARISHPNVIPVHDVGTYAATSEERDGARRSVFVVMELVEGIDLDRWLARNAASSSEDVEPRPWAEVLDVFVAAGRGLAAAHAAGILHRDFKPSNVLVGHDGRVRVVDFGLARPIAGGAFEEASLDDSGGVQPVDALHTRTGTVLGTPYYMAPEQLEGGEATERTDQYAFCVALYLGLFGRGPFARHELRRMLSAKRRGDILPPPSNTSVPGWLSNLVWRGLSPKADDRFASMRELLDTLEQRRRRRGTILRATVGSALIIAATGLGLGLGRLEPGAVASPPPGDPPAIQDPAPPTVATPASAPVLAFGELGGDVAGELAWAVEGLPNLMSEELRDREGIRVLAYHALRHTLAGVPEAERLDRLVGRGANTIVASEIRSDGGALTLAITVRDAAGKVVYERSVATNPTSLADDARALARSLGERLTGRPLEADASMGAVPITYERALQQGITALHGLKLEAAEKYFDEARRLAPDAAAARFYAAIVAEWKGGGVEAAERYAEAAAADLTAAQRRYVEAAQLRMAEGHVAAVAPLRAAAKDYPEDPYVAYGLFEALYHSGDGAAALTQMERLAELAPRFVPPWMHVLDRAIAVGDTAAAARALRAADAAGADDLFLAMWGAKVALLDGGTDAALARMRELPESEDEAQSLIVEVHAIRGDLSFARARATQALERHDASWARPLLAICTAMGDEACRKSVLADERRRISRVPRSDLATIEWLSLVTHETIVGDQAQIESVVRTLGVLAEPHMTHDLRYVMTTTLVAAAQDDVAALEAASKSPFAEVAAVADAVLAGRAGDHRRAADRWRAALGLAIDSRFVPTERLGLARAELAAGAPAAARAACDELITPRAFDWSWGAAVGPCLLLSAEAAHALGDEADARARVDRLVALRSSAGPRDRLIEQARARIPAP